MKLMEDVFLTHSTEIKTTPDEIFKFFDGLVDDESYRLWHPEDHLTFRWLKGEPWQEGSIVYAEEYFHGKLHKLKFVITRVVPGRLIEYGPVSRFLRRYVPGLTFKVEQKGDVCLYTASVHYRLALIPRLLAPRHVKEGLASVRKHMAEEGENLKKTLEEG